MPKAQHKFGAQAVKGCLCCGRNHPSKMEAKRCEFWHALKKCGGIMHIDIHPTVTLPSGNYTPDFAIYTYDEPTDTIGVLYEEVKGAVRPDFAIRWREFDRYHPMRPLSVVTLRGKRWEPLAQGERKKKKKAVL